MKKIKGSKLEKAYMKFEKEEFDLLEKEEGGEIRLSDAFLKRVEEIEASFEKTKTINFYERPFFKVAGILVCMAAMLIFYINGDEENRIYDKGIICIGDSDVKAYAHAEDAFVEVRMLIEYKAVDGSIRSAVQTNFDYEKVSVDYIGEADSKVLFVGSKYEIEFPSETEHYYSYTD